MSEIPPTPEQRDRLNRLLLELGFVYHEQARHYICESPAFVLYAKFSLFLGLKNWILELAHVRANETSEIEISPVTGAEKTVLNYLEAKDFPARNILRLKRLNALID